MKLKNKLEALLFASGTYLTEEDLANLSGESKAKVKKGLKELEKSYSESENSLSIQNGERGWKMGVKQDYHEIVKKIIADTELETPVLETLSVIAWKRPILQSEVVDMRGTGAYEHISLLMDLGFITREKHGRTYKLKLAEKFFEYFDVEGDQSIRELFKNVKRPEPEAKEEDVKLEVVDYKEEMQKNLENNKLGQLEIVDDPLEKRKVSQEELDELERELEEISKRTDEHSEGLEEFKKEEDSEDIDELAEKESKEE